MKRVFPKRIIPLSALFAFAALFSYSCYQPPIFAAIEDEVKLEKPTLVGTIQGIAVSGSTVYVANGNLTRRTGTGSWQQMSIPKDLCTGIAASDDETSVYGVFSDSYGSQSTIYLLSGDSWTAVSGSESITKVLPGAGGTVFAFRQSGSSFTAYTITGSATPTALTAVTHTAPVGSAIGNAAYFATTTGVFTAAGVLVADSPSAVRAIAGDGTATIYVITDTNIYSYDGIAWSAAKSHTFNSPRSALFLESGSTDLILVGTTAGYKEVPVTGATIGDSQDPGSSAVSSIATSSASQYASSLKQWPVIELCMVSPGTGGNAYDLYAAVFETRYGGLWAYYPSTRPEWNRE